jgi:hypothetical protein
MHRRSGFTIACPPLNCDSIYIALFICQSLLTSISLRISFTSINNRTDKSRLTEKSIPKALLRRIPNKHHIRTKRANPRALNRGRHDAGQLNPRRPSLHFMLRQIDRPRRRRVA